MSFVVPVFPPAGLVKPTSGGGIYTGVRSALHAAAVAAECCEAGSFRDRDLAAYEHRCREAFGSDLRHALVLARLTHRWPSAILGAVASGPEVLRQYLLVATGELTYCRFVRWLVPRALWRWMRSGFRRAS
jgi:flavin-dependent dehydrogenase